MDQTPRELGAAGHVADLGDRAPTDSEPGQLRSRDRYGSPYEAFANGSPAAGSPPPPPSSTASSSTPRQGDREARAHIDAFAAMLREDIAEARRLADEAAIPERMEWWNEGDRRAEKKECKPPVEADTFVPP